MHSHRGYRIGRTLFTYGFVVGTRTLIPANFQKPCYTILYNVFAIFFSKPMKKLVYPCFRFQNLSDFRLKIGQVYLGAAG